jgi:predicted transcriptional regulator
LGGKPYLNLGLRWYVLVVGLRVVAAKLPDDLYRALVERARREDVSVSKLVREAVRAYLGLPPQDRGDAVLEELRRRIAGLEERVSKLEVAVAEVKLGLEAGCRSGSGR